MAGSSPSPFGTADVDRGERGHPDQHQGLRRVLRELAAVTETGTDLDRAWAQQAIDALLALDKAAGAARAAGKAAVDPETREAHEDWYRKAAATGIALNAGRHGKLRQKQHRRTRSPHQRLPGPALDPGNRIGQPGAKANAARARAGPGDRPGRRRCRESR